jgi:hypothetical protein
MPNTTNLVLPYPAVADNPSAAVLAALVQAADPYAGPWLTWTPVVTQSTNPSQTVQYAKYKVVTKTCTFAFKVKMLAGGTGGNVVLITLPPVAPKFTTVDMPRGQVSLVNRTARGALVSPAASTTQVRIMDDSGNYTTALLINDVIYGWGRYEIA